MATWAGPVATRRVRPSLWFLLGFSLVLFFGSSDVRAEKVAEGGACPAGYTPEAQTGTWYWTKYTGQYGLSGLTSGQWATQTNCSGVGCDHTEQAQAAWCSIALPAIISLDSNCATSGYHCEAIGPATYSGQPSCKYERVNESNNARTAYYTYGAEPRTGGSLSSPTLCMLDPPECDFSNGSESFVSFHDLGTSPPLAVCDGASGFGSNCTAFPRSNSTSCDARCGTIYDTINETCTEAGATPPPEDIEAVAGQRCTTVGDAQYCWDTGQDNQCGYINGQPICLGATPKGGCQDAGSGALCDPSASSPPAPDDGLTPGTPATPDGQVKADTGATTNVNTYNYYSGTTVSNSTVGATTGNPTESGDFDGDGYTSPDQEEEWTGSFGDPGSEFGEFGDGTGIWGESAWDMGTRTGSMKSFLAGTFPFSLIAAGPLTMSYGGAMPTISYTASGHTASSSLSMWADLFTLFRACMSVLLIWGFWLVMIETVKGWSK